jgi:hypothetical protein
VVGDGAVDVDRVDVGVLQQVVEVGVPLVDLVAVAHLVHFRLVAAADGVHLGVGVVLVDRDELRPEAQSDDRDAHLAGHGWLLRRLIRMCYG